MIPTGKIAAVEGTPLDFRKPTVVASRIDGLVKTPALGYDHNFVLSPRGGEPKMAAKLRHAASGRTLVISCTQPGIQLYSGNFLEGQLGKGGKAYPLRSAICLETQHFPDSVNHPEFPSTIVKPGDVYRHSATFAFTVE
jgi:aldose 1-epimerase